MAVPDDIMAAHAAMMGINAQGLTAEDARAALMLVSQMAVACAEIRRCLVRAAEEPSIWRNLPEGIH